MIKVLLPTPTLRATLLLSLAMYFLVAPAKNSSDIIASGFAISCFCILAFIFWLLFINANRIIKLAKLEMSFNQSDDYFSNESVTILIKFSNLKLSGLLTAVGRINLVEEELEVARHVLSSKNKADFILSEKVIFPHRGLWNFRSFTLNLQDQLGLFRLKAIEFPLKSSIKIHPQKADMPEWIAVSSAYKEDDTIAHHLERKGERYDFKPYHPSDGSRRIIWKLYAKSGELFARHPEPAYSPEGKIGILCMARKNQDWLADQIINFTERLEQESISIYVSCLSDRLNLAKSTDELKQNLLEQCWASELADQSSVMLNLNNLISSLGSENSSAQNICIAISEDGLADQDYKKLILFADKYLSAKGISTHFLISKSNFRNNSGTTGISGLKSKLLNLLIEQEQNTGNKDSLSHAAFLAHLGKSNSHIQWSA